MPPPSVRLERTTTTRTTLYVPEGNLKLLLERTLVCETSDVYLTPNCTLTGPPDVIPRRAPLSPASDEYRTPDTTLLENGPDTFAMPTYFDKKKRTAEAGALGAAVEPLTNFQMFKQKSLNTIPALLERNRKSQELFNNFPFLTPLANRKSSLVSGANRLSGCIEDEFYCIPSDPEAELGSAECVDVRHRFRSLSNQALSEDAVATSTPKSEDVQRPFEKGFRIEPAVAALRHSYTDHVR